VAWLKFIVMLIVWRGFLLCIALMLNLTGDCAPEIRSCGEGARELSFLVLAFGGIGLGYYSFLFNRRRRHG
jgi:hypothetical protein